METPDLSRARWRTSSYSGTNGACVEVADSGAQVLLRDTKDREGGYLTVPAAAWTAFLSSAARTS